LEAAKKMMAAGEAEAIKNGWNVAITIVGAHGDLIMFHKLDDTQPGSIAVSQGKAKTAALFKRPSKALEEMIAGGKTAFLAVEGIVPLQGGVPVVVEGKIVGAVGVSGVTSAQDEQVAMAAIAVLNT
jgi:glc operon protein GlcG